MKPIIEIKKLNLRYGKTKIFSDINIKIEEGSYNLLVGGNGSGKTSLMRCLLGLIDEYEGEFFFEGKLISKHLISENFGYIPQKSKINSEFPISVKEVIELECQNACNKCGIDTIDHLKALQITNLYSKQIADLSGGELQKVLIARGLVTNPKVLILDEPTNNLDHKSKLNIKNYIKLLNKKRKKTIIHITHDTHELGEHDYNIIKLVDGKVENNND